MIASRTMMIAYRNRAEGATLAGGNWSGTLTLVNLKDSDPNNVARSTSCKRLHTRFRADLGQVFSSLRCINLHGHRLSRYAYYRMRVSRASLDLIFDGEDWGGILDDRLTKTGGDNGTRINQYGVPVKAKRTNNLLQASTIGNASWTKNAVTVTDNQATDPDNGGLNADKVLPNTGTGDRSVSQSVTLTAGAACVSAYVKGSGIRFFYLQIGGSVVTYDTTLLTFNVISGATVGNIRITQAPLGYYRLSFACVAAAGANTIAIGAANNLLTANYTGDGASFFYLWGTQCEDNSDVTDYIVTTTVAVTSTLSGRIGYGSRTENLLLQSEDANTTWTKTNVNVAVNSTLAPGGQATGDTVTATAGGSSATLSQSVTVQASGTYTFSVFVKASVGTSVQLRMSDNVTGQALATFTPATGGAGALAAGPYSNVTSTSTNYGNGWYRLTLTGTQPAAQTTMVVGFYLANNADAVIVWGFQLERAAAAGYYIPTTTQARTDLAPWRTNRQRWSQDYRQTGTWSVQNATLYPDEATAPDGTATAVKLASTTASGVSVFDINCSPAQIATRVGQAFTVSVYGKAAEWSRLYIFNNHGGNGTAWFDLSAGTVLSAPAAWRTSIESIGSGWYRCSVTVQTTAASGQMNIGMAPPAATLGNAGSPITAGGTGDGTSGIYLWGVQAEDYLTVTPYIATNTGPRTAADECLGLLIEPASTNLAQRSEEFDNATWTKTKVSVTANAFVAPIGLATADALIEDNTTGQHVSYQTMTVTANTIYTASVFVRAGARTRVNLRYLDSTFTDGVLVTADLVTGTLVQVTAQGAGTSTAGTIEEWGNGWYRVSLTAKVNAASTSVVLAAYLVNAGTNDNYLGDNASGVYLFGAQLEAGTFATSYIPTVGSTVARVADDVSITGANFTAIFNSANTNTLSVSGTMIATTAATFPRLLSLVIAASPNNDEISIYRSAASNSMPGSITAGGSNTMDQGTGAVKADGCRFNAALVFTPQRSTVVLDGVATAPDTSVTLPAVDKLYIGGAVRFQPVPCAYFSRVSLVPEEIKISEARSITTQTGSGIDAIGFNSGRTSALKFSFVDDTPSDWGARHDLSETFDATSGRYVEIELDDVTNANGYEDLGCMHVSGAIQPGKTVSFGGFADDWIDHSGVVESEGGKEFGMERDGQRCMQFAFNNLNATTEPQQLAEMKAYLKRVKDVVLIRNPADAADSQLWGGRGQLRKLGQIEYPSANRRTAAFEWKYGL